MELKLILEASQLGKSHTTHLKEAMQVVYRWLHVEGLQMQVQMGEHDCVLTMWCHEQLNKIQLAKMAQTIANVCQTNVRLPMVFRNGLSMQMQYHAQLPAA